MTEHMGETFYELYADSLSDCPSDFEINCKRAPYEDPPSRLSGKLSDHVLEQIVIGVKTNPTGRCRVFSSKGKRSETRYVGKTCCVPLHAAHMICPEMQDALQHMIISSANISLKQKMNSRTSRFYKSKKVQSSTDCISLNHQRQ